VAFNELMLEEITAWCRVSSELAEERQRSQHQFFDEDDPRPVKYWPGAEGLVSRERRFLGYFVFDHQLATGETPAEAAAKHLYRGEEEDEILEALRGTRFVFAIVSSVIGRSVYLEIEDESLEVRTSTWSGLLRSGQAVVAHLVPIRHGYWIPGPGWLVWPTAIGPGMRSSLKQFQMTPLVVERFLEGRSAEPGAKQRPAPPRDRTLKQAVDRMTEAAQRAGRLGLVRSTREWEALVCAHLQDVSTGAFAKDIIARIGEPEDIDELQGWLDLAMNIWNNTPQPDRGGKSAIEMNEEFEGRADRTL
jgi:hypothetical protein